MSKIEQKHFFYLLTPNTVTVKTSCSCHPLMDCDVGLHPESQRPPPHSIHWQLHNRQCSHRQSVSGSHSSVSPQVHRSCAGTHWRLGMMKWIAIAAALHAAAVSHFFYAAKKGSFSSVRSTNTSRRPSVDGGGFDLPGWRWLWGPWHAAACETTKTWKWADGDRCRDQGETDSDA